jgi:glycerophosphoryl diester phosphodiesterase
MALGPENTLAAFDLGMAAGADGLELDVRLSADGIPVVHHDERLERTTDGSGPIAARTAADLARLDAAYHFAVAGRFAFRGQDIGIPSLREVLHRYRDARIIVEMKVDDPALGHAVVREVRAADAIDRVCAAGYGVRAVRAVRDAEPTLATSATRPEVQRALRRTWMCWPVRRARYHGYQIPERAGCLRIVSPRFVRYAHEGNLKVQVWTVDTEPDMRRLLGWGVDALISNRPDLAVKIRDEWASHL